MSERKLSFWGWGWEDQFPDADTRRQIGMQVGQLLGGEPLEPLPPPVLDAVELPAPRIEAPSDLYTADKETRASHTYGKSFRDLARGFAGDFSAAPDLVATPHDEEDVERILSWCATHDVAVIPFGGGTSVVGGTEAAVGERFTGAVSLDLRGLGKVIEVDEVSRAACVEAGTTGPSLEAQLAPSGLTLRHFPQSFEFSTLGGWIATRAGGHYATLYTRIDDRVESIRMLTGKGWWESRRLPSSGAGPSPDRLALGSEGILGVITQAWVRLVPRPRWRSRASGRFADMRAGLDAVRALAQSELHPANCRLLDEKEAKLHSVSMDGEAVLLLGFESADHPTGPALDRAMEIVRDGGGRIVDGSVKHTDASDSEARGKADATWRDAFIQMPYLFNTLVSLGLVVDTFETACTWDRFEALHEAILTATHAALDEVCGGGLVTCRFTHIYPDGPAPYYTFVGRGRPGERLQQWQAIKTAASDAILAHGGTITHHHGVGRVHRPWYDRQRPEPFAVALRAAKRALDPAGVLNPGVLIDAS